MDIGIIFTAVGAAKSIAQLMGVVDSFETKVDRLVRSELNAGFRNLDQASVSEKEREHLLREARACFNKAVSLETGYRSRPGRTDRHQQLHGSTDATFGNGNNADRGRVTHGPAADRISVESDLCCRGSDLVADVD